MANSTITYGYDALGRVASRAVAGEGTESYAYDAIGRLVGDGNDLGQFAMSYLGETGQITSRALPSPSSISTVWSYLPNTGDRRLSSINNDSGAQTFSFTTTDEGLVTGVNGAGAIAENWAYGYDAANRLVSAVSPAFAGAGFERRRRYLHARSRRQHHLLQRHRRHLQQFERADELGRHGSFLRFGRQFDFRERSHLFLGCGPFDKLRTVSSPSTLRAFRSP